MRFWRSSFFWWSFLAIWLLSALPPVVPVTIDKGGGHTYSIGRFPLAVMYLSPVAAWPDIAGHLLLCGILAAGLSTVRQTIRRQPHNSSGSRT